MKYWASKYAIIPVERDPFLADAGMAPQNEWLSPGITSWMRCGEHSRGLFLQLLLSSMFLIAGPSAVQASGVVYKRMCALEYMSGPSVGVQTPGFAPASAMYGVIPGTSNIKHQTSNAGHQTITANTGIHSPAPCPNPRSESPQSFLHSFIPSFLSPNGALLAHQTTSIANPSPTARNGAAARTPLPEAGERGYKMNHHFQICTRGYLAWPGIPIPASGLFIGHSGGNHRVKVERWKGLKTSLSFSLTPSSSRAETLGYTWKYRNTLPAQAMGQALAYFHVFPPISLFQSRYLPPQYYPNTITPQHHNTIIPQHPPPNPEEP